MSRGWVARLYDANPQPYVPLLQKQWEALLPFRSQIVQRATASLRSREAVDTKTLSDTTLAIVLLDSLPIPDVLDLYLSQRLKALKDHLAHVPPTGNRKRSNSKVGAAAAARGAAQQRDSIAHVLSDAIKCLLDAVDHARDVFEPKRRLSGNESVIAEAIRLVQNGEDLPPTHPSGIIRRVSTHRKTRMASISLPLPPANHTALGGGGPPVSTPRILQALPSSQILLRYLPSGVTGFTPFIAPSSEPELSKKLEAWQTAAIQLLRQSVPSWLADLQSVSDVWAVRSAIGDLLGDSAFEQQISQALEAEWGARVQTIWTAKLDTLIKNAESTLRTASEKIRAGEESLDNDPERFIFSDITFPPAPVSSIGAATNSTAFTTFLSTVHKRASFRTPLLDSVLTVLESAASDLKADLAGLPETFYGEYRTKVTTALDAFVNSLGDVLAAVGGHRDATGSVEAELFVGRVALYVVHTSPFLADLTGDTGVDLCRCFVWDSLLTYQLQSRPSSWRSTSRRPTSGRRGLSPPKWHPCNPCLPSTAAPMRSERHGKGHTQHSHQCCLSRPSPTSSRVCAGWVSLQQQTCRSCPTSCQRSRPRCAASRAGEERATRLSRRRPSTSAS